MLKCSAVELGTDICIVNHTAFNNTGLRPHRGLGQTANIQTATLLQ
jgi:hypothetical protein